MNETEKFQKWWDANWKHLNFGILSDHVKSAEMAWRAGYESARGQFQNESDFLDDLFGEASGQNLWKNKYKISWCDLCETYSISCLEENCHGSSCNGGGCEKCSEITADFNSAKTRPVEYLSEPEKIVARKIQFLKKYILESLKMGDYVIDWQKLETAGILCDTACDIFSDETKNLIRYQENL